ncbi:HNH endonuclease [Virgibacillus halodenitrificans]|uniref:HNH endonuclease n=1 Tax=Virgibacillus halodenitrificans TaxID=1482 RepID=A0ABR7VLH8_VIRHA|nr:HNH endonuclease [Virgibacillus halodenitrificans]MBD1222766.1 HNH endonuclease [Virgibacillus halodenitrificans]
MEKRKINTLPTLETVKDCYEIHLSEDGYAKVFNNKTGKYLKQTIGKGKDNYVVCSLVTVDGKSKKTYLHRLIGLAFIDGYKEGYFVDHGDNDKENNHISNLEWVSHKENTQRAVKNGCGVGRPKVEKKPKIYRTKLERSVASSVGLTYEDVTRIFKLLDDGYSQSKIARILNVKQPTINQIVNGKRWQEHPSVIEYRCKVAV